MRKNISRTVCAALAALVMVSGYWMADQTKVDTTVPQLVSHVDALDGTITIEGEETPLAAKPVVKKKTTTQKNTQKIQMATKAKKSSKKTTKRTVKTSNTQVTSKQKIKTDKTIQTTTVTTLKKKSKVKTVKTTVKTTTTTTTTALAPVKNNNVSASASSTKVNAAGNTSAVVKKTVAVRSIAPKAHANVLSAYEKMGFTVKVDSTVNYSGKFDARAQEITVQKNSDDAIYHELGHYVAFTAGNVDQTAEFKNIYAKEKNAFKGTRNNDSYIKSSPEEYFAESYQDYVERPDVLKKQRPLTYKFIVDAVSKVTDARAVLLYQMYASLWK